MAEREPRCRTLDRHSAQGGKESNRDGIGARIRIGNQVNEMTTTVGYASSADWGVHFGLGKLKTIPKIEIRWPDGGTQVLTGVAADQVLTVSQK